MDKTTCTLPDCDKPVKRMGFCYGHYMKNWRYGTPTPDHGVKWEDLAGRRYGTLTAIERVGRQWRCVCDCGRARLANTGDLNRYGDESTCGHRPTHGRSDDAGYGAAHDRIRRARGAASEHDCVGCGGSAYHWSYDHSDPDERVATEPPLTGIAYSLNPEHYSPRCVPCHKRFDLDRLDAAKVK